jgi:hypothetical protein
VQHRAAVLAIAVALLIHRTLGADQIDNIIASAPERARRADWAGGWKARARSPPYNVDRQEATKAPCIAAQLKAALESEQYSKG